MSRFRAVVKDERSVDAPWFIYVHGAPNGPVYAARFGQRRHANRIAAAMNKAWADEGRLLAVGGVLREESDE